MLACVDVQYGDEGNACAACLLFEKWEDAAARRELTAMITGIADYVPGQFYLRELPCILEVLKEIEEDLDVIVVDGYAWLAEGKAGLGAHLYDALNGEIPVIGVAKNYFRGSEAIPVLRGVSEKPLYITAAGIDPTVAAELVKTMDGEFRFPSLLQKVDRLCKDTLAAK
ncbi:MAG: endonuclease V [Phycisphaerales bacterium]|jgi:deoxyribonuclease V|nr:endonuclease V [Phycisphaerales bacterium]